MTADTSIVLATAAILVVALYSLVASAERQRRHAARERQLRRATVELEKHALALADLDDRDTPAVVLEYALRASESLTSPTFAAYVRDHVLNCPEAFDAFTDELKGHAQDASDAETELGTALRGMIAARPDLLGAFVRAFSTGLTAFSTRWPECAPYAHEMQSALLKQPADPARRVVNLSNRQAARAAPPVNALGAAAA